jgi:flagella basal body P-ring formation protein FlgA
MNAFATEISGDCVTLSEILGEDYPAAEVQCGFEPGETKNVSRSMVISTLRRIGAGQPELLSKSYPVKRSGHQLLEEYIEAELRAIYQEAHPDAQVEIEKLRFMKAVWLVDENSYYRIEADSSQKGFVQGEIQTETNRFNIQFNVKLMEEGYTLTDRVTKGDLLADFVEKSMVDTTNLRHALVKDPLDLIALKSINKGVALTSDMVKEKPDLMKGETVQLLYNSGRVFLEITAIAYTDAVTGKAFQVKNPDSGKVFSALYQGNGVAVVK